MPGIYWLAVVLISVVGTLVSDNLVENYGVTLETTTIAFSAILIAVFATWYAVERTLSVHTIFTTRRESFYWLAILFTFALGTSAGDFLSEQLELGYLAALGIFAGAIVVVAILHFGLKMNAILSFWLAYILTRPLGASIGDYLASPTEEGGLGLGTNLTSIIFLSTILALVVFLAISKRDVIRSGPVAAARDLVGERQPGGPRRPQQGRGDRRAARRGEAAHGRRRGALLRPRAEPRPPRLRSQRLRLRRRRGAAGQGVEPAAGPGRGERRRAGSPNSPNAYDDIVEELDGAATARSSSRRRPATSRTGSTSTCPHRISELGYPTETVARHQLAERGQAFGGGVALSALGGVGQGRALDRDHHFVAGLGQQVAGGTGDDLAAIAVPRGRSGLSRRARRRRSRAPGRVGPRQRP